MAISSWLMVKNDFSISIGYRVLSIMKYCKCVYFVFFVVHGDYDSVLNYLNTIEKLL